MKKDNLGTIDNDILELFLRGKIHLSTNAENQPWLKLVEKLPEGMRQALLTELKSGNKVSEIQDCGWPQKGSIVVLLSFPFRNKDLDSIQGVEFRKMNDPHYWMEDVHAIVDGVEHLIIN